LQASLVSRLRIASHTDPEGLTTIELAGSFRNPSIGEVKRAVEKAQIAGSRIRVDLGELVLVDRNSLQVLVSLLQDNVELINCPHYIQPWIERPLDAKAGGDF